MDTGPHGRRAFLKTIGLLGAAGFPAIGPGLAPGRPTARSAVPAPRAACDPAAKYALSVTEVAFRRNQAGRMLMARVYRPEGAGPFPTLLDLHGGAWTAEDRRAEEPMDRALAASGVLVVAIDLTLAPEAPYPVCVLSPVRGRRAPVGGRGGAEHRSRP